jgi:hypothetical protein
VEEIQRIFELGGAPESWSERNLFVVAPASLEHEWRGNLLRYGLEAALRDDRFIIYVASPPDAIQSWAIGL